MERKKNHMFLRDVVVALTFAALFFMSVFAGLLSETNPAYAADKQKVFKWRMQDIWGTETVYHKANQKLVDRIRQMSDGRLDITMFPRGAMATPRNTFDAMSRGVFQGHISAPAYWAGKIPACTILMSVPAGIDNVDDFNVWFWERGGVEIAREAYAPYGLYFVGPGIIEQNYQFLKKNNPVRTIADYKGLKIRTIPGLQSDLLKALGAAPVFLPMTEVYTAVETGVLEGVAGYTVVGWHDFGIHEITKWIIQPGFLQPATNLDVVVNMKAWKKLPADLQAIFECAVREWGQYWYAGDHLENAKALKKMLDYGLEILTLPDADLVKIREIALPIVDKWAAKDPLAAKAWESQKEYLRFLGKIK
jgi:TRAP-type mannitol/chloroaromatic compound transport system substrate-binding protein